MPELITRANQAILEAQWLRREGRSLRLEAATLASQLGQTIAQTHGVEKEIALLQTSLERSFSRL